MNARQPGRLPALLFTLAALLLSPQLDASRALTSAAANASAPSYLETRIGASETEGRDLVGALGALSAEERSGYVVSSGGSAAGEHLAVLVHNGGLKEVAKKLLGGAGKTEFVTLRHVEGMQFFEARRKAKQLFATGEKGLLERAANPVARDRGVTRRYRRALVRKIEAQYRAVNPGFADRLIARVEREMQPDHIWELQLRGPDTSANLRMLHTFTNFHFGVRQLRPQLRAIEPGTTIRILLEGFD